MNDPARIFGKFSRTFYQCIIRATSIHVTFIVYNLRIPFFYYWVWKKKIIYLEPRGFTDYPTICHTEKNGEASDGEKNGEKNNYLFRHCATVEIQRINCDEMVHVNFREFTCKTWLISNLSEVFNVYQPSNDDHKSHQHNRWSETLDSSYCDGKVAKFF